MINTPLQKRALNLMDEASDLVDLIDNSEWKQSLMLWDTIVGITAELGKMLSQQAFDAGMSKDEIAEASGMKPEAFRRLEKSQ